MSHSRHFNSNKSTSSASNEVENNLKIERLLINDDRDKGEGCCGSGVNEIGKLLMVDSRRRPCSLNDEGKNETTRNGTNNDAAATMQQNQHQLKYDEVHRTATSNNDSTHLSNISSTATATKYDTVFDPQSSITSKLMTNNNANSTQNKKARTMFPLQQRNYGPKATLKKVTEDYLLLVQDPLSQQLSWTKPPLHVLVIKKLGNCLLDPFNEIVKFLIYDHKLIVYVEENEYENELFRLDDQIHAAMSPRGNQIKPSLRKFCLSSPNYSCRSMGNTDVNKIDLVVCLGGDGTLLHASGLFQKSCPPVLSIHMGSLGFLCPFDFDDYREYMNGVIKGGVPLLLRNRIKFRLGKSLPSTNDQPSTTTISPLNDSVEMDPDADPDDDSNELVALNEVVISRGPSPYLSNLDLYINDYLMTTVQGDGLIISTPTGSTAYAMAAGASMCHPSVQSIIIAPICPHSLSFRPIVVPAGVELKIALNDDARHPSAWYSVDGRNTAELKHGYHISITASEFPVPSICRTDQVSDWFEGLATCLHWNQRQKQLPANACYLRDSRGQSLCSPQSNSLLYSSLSSKSSSTSSLKINNNNNNPIQVSSQTSNLTKSICQSNEHETPTTASAHTNTPNGRSKPLVEFTLEGDDGVI